MTSWDRIQEQHGVVVLAEKDFWQRDTPSVESDESEEQLEATEED